MGQVFKIRVRHDNSLVGADWYLDQVEVLDVEMEEVYMFLCERWLSTKKEDKCIDRTFFVKVGHTLVMVEDITLLLCSLQIMNVLLAAVKVVKSDYIGCLSYVGFRDTKVKEFLIQIPRGSLRPNWGWTEMPTKRKRRKKWRWWRTVQVRLHNCCTYFSTLGSYGTMTKNVFSCRRKGNML